MILISELYVPDLPFPPLYTSSGGFLYQLKIALMFQWPIFKLATLATFNYGGAKFGTIHINAFYFMIDNDKIDR